MNNNDMAFNGTYGDIRSNNRQITALYPDRKQFL